MGPTSVEIRSARARVGEVVRTRPLGSTLHVETSTTGRLAPVGLAGPIPGRDGTGRDRTGCQRNMVHYTERNFVDLNTDQTSVID